MAGEDGGWRGRGELTREKGRRLLAHRAVVFVTVLVTGAAVQACASRGQVAQPLASVDVALDALRQDWTSAYEAGRVDALHDLYTEDAIRMPYDAVTQNGRDSILAAYSRSFAARAFVPSIRLVALQVEVRGDLAVESGTYDETLVPRGSGRTLREVGKYVSVSRRDSAGRWRYSLSIFNRDRPAAPIPPP